LCNSLSQQFCVHCWIYECSKKCMLTLCKKSLLFIIWWIFMLFWVYSFIHSYFGGVLVSVSEELRVEGCKKVRMSFSEGQVWGIWQIFIAIK
jgi:hypothetical protein